MIQWWLDEIWDESLEGKIMTVCLFLGVFAAAMAVICYIAGC